ncbi:MAG: 4Fe-4S dicluster domain-containing protein [Pseudomonadota bacterium]
MEEKLDALMQETGLHGCLECGKCTASCPMGELYASFTYAMSPRGIIEKARHDKSILYSAAIWHCLECDECTKACVSAVTYRVFMKKLRDLARGCGVIPSGIACRRCRKVFLPAQAMEYMEGKISGLEEARDYLFLCPSCRTRVFARRNRKSFMNR